MVSKTASSLAAAASLLPGATTLQCDVSDYASVKATFAALDAKGIALAGLVNSAGMSHGALLVRQSEESIREITNTNLLGTIFCTKEGVRHMLKHSVKGSIVNVTSVVAGAGYPGISVYAASKAAVLGFTKAIAVEMASRGIRINAVAPGFVQTDLTKDIPEAMRANVLESTPMKRLTSAAEVAKGVLYLLESQDVTGTILTVDCGLSASLI